MTDLEGKTLLNVAIDRGRVEVVRELVEVMGIDPNTDVKEGYRPLFGACFAGHARIAQELLRLGAIPEVATANAKVRGKSLLHVALPARFTWTWHEFYSKQVALRLIRMQMG